MSDSNTSSADPSALTAYSDAGLRIDAQLEASAVRLAGALSEFSATCREYSIGVDASLADQLRAHARRTVEHDLWVRRVAERFQQADSGAASVEPGADLVIASVASKPLSVSDWSFEQRIEYALQRTRAHLPQELVRQLEAVLTPETLAWVIGILAVWAIGHAFGYGEVVDAGVAILALATLGPEAIRLGQETGGFFTGIAGARTPDDLDTAGAHLATVISIIGVDGLMALLAHKAGTTAKARVPEGLRTRTPPSTRAVGVTPEGVEMPVSGDGWPRVDGQILEMAGETDSTIAGKRSHKTWSDTQRASGKFDEVGGPIDDLSGEPIKVPRRVDLQTGDPQPNTRMQVSKPDAVSFTESRIVELKPLGRAVAKDRQEIIRFIRAFEQRQGKLPETIEIQYYDSTGVVVSSQTFTPADFLPPASIPVAPVQGELP